jgi:hypothetical protein
MRTVFADAHYWLAVANPRDSWRREAYAARNSLGKALLVTTDEVLGEFLTGMSKGGPQVRRIAVRMVRGIFQNPRVRVVAQSRSSFLLALERYAARDDKEYSLTDCAAMNTMDAEGIREILTNDHHFEQEGYTILIKSPSE